MPRLHIRTEHLDIDTAKCTACGRCVEACAAEVLKVQGIQFLLNDRHIHVVRPKACTGCLACVKACPEGAIVKR